MGHFYEVVEGVGQDRREAFWEAWGEYEREHGTRCTLRCDWLARKDAPGWGDGGDATDVEDYGDGKPRCYAELVERVPPMRRVERPYPAATARDDRRTRGTMPVIVSQQPDPDAPREQWLERWRFRLHYHA